MSPRSRVLKKHGKKDTEEKGSLMSFSVEDFHDLIRLLEERPEWRREMRRLVLTDELLSLPEQIGELRTHTEQRFQELATAQRRTEEQVSTLSAQVAELAAAQRRTEGQV